MTRTEKDGTLTVLADSYEGKKLNSPNDLALDSKGRIYFTDPRYGRTDTMEIRDAAGKLVEGVYRIEEPGKITRILTGQIGAQVERPNGILVSPDDLEHERLGPQEGFVLSRINGESDIESILSVCPFREADSLRMIKKLWDSGIIGPA